MSLNRQSKLLSQTERRLLDYYTKNFQAIDFSASPVEIQIQYRQFIENFVRFSNNELIRSSVSAAAMFSMLLGQPVIFDALGPTYLDAAAQQYSLMNSYFKEQGNLVLRYASTEIPDPTTTSGQKMMRALMGLTFNQAIATFQYRDRLINLDRSLLYRKTETKENRRRVERAIRNEKPLSDKQVENMVTNYARNISKHRATVIAESEAVRIVNQGLELVVAQAVLTGLVAKEQVTMVWNTRDDGRVRSSHMSMHGQKRKRGEPFVSGNGNRLSFPGDPAAPMSDRAGCRCLLTVDVTKR